MHGGLRDVVSWWTGTVGGEREVGGECNGRGLTFRLQFDLSVPTTQPRRPRARSSCPASHPTEEVSQDPGLALSALLARLFALASRVARRRRRRRLPYCCHQRCRPPRPAARLVAPHLPRLRLGPRRCQGASFFSFRSSTRSYRPHRRSLGSVPRAAARRRAPRRLPRAKKRMAAEISQKGRRW